MNYLTIIIIGYGFNLLVLLFFTVLIMIYYKSILIEMEKALNIIKIKRNFLIKKSINPFRSQDFLIVLPFGYGVYLLWNMFKPKDKLLNYIIDNINNADNYYNYLIQKNKLYKEDND